MAGRVSAIGGPQAETAHPHRGSRLRFAGGSASIDGPVAEALADLVHGLVELLCARRLVVVEEGVLLAACRAELRSAHADRRRPTRPASQGRVVELLRRCEEGVHVNLQDVTLLPRAHGIR